MVLKRFRLMLQASIRLLVRCSRDPMMIRGEVIETVMRRWEGR